MSLEKIPSSLAKQEVPIQLGQLADFLQKQPAIENKPAVTKEDFIRLAKLKLEKMFEPKIQARKNASVKAEEAYNKIKAESCRNDLAVKIAEDHSEKLAGKVEEAFSYITEANKQLGKISHLFAVPLKAGLLNEPETKVSLYSYNEKEVVYTIEWDGFGKTKNQTAKASAKLKELIAKMNKARDLRDSTLESYNILCASYEKAKKDIINDVEMNLLEDAIGKSDEDVDLAQRISDGLNDRINGQKLLTK